MNVGIDFCAKGLPHFEHPLEQSVRDVTLADASAEKAIWPYATRRVTNLDQGFSNFFQRLAQGLETSVLVVGGSETAGADCIMPSGKRGRNCAWSAHLQTWFSRFGNVRITNTAKPGTTSKMFLSQIAVVGIANRGADLIIIDYLVNDASDQDNILGNFTGKYRPISERDLVISPVYEVLILALRDTFPDAALVSFEAACRKCEEFKLAHTRITEHYGILTVDYNQIMQQKLSAKVIWGWKNHPDWRVHTYIADLVAHGISMHFHTWCRLLVNHTESHSGIESVDLREPSIDSTGKKSLKDHFNYLLPGKKSPSEGEGFRETVYSQKILQQYRTCRKARSIYDAYVSSEAIDRISSDKNSSRGVPAHVNSSSPLLNGFTLLEDRPGKPGWISRIPRSTITFHLLFGDEPTFCITFLRSYEGMANAFLIMNNRSMPLFGLWHQRTSLLDMKCYHAYLPFDFQRTYIGRWKSKRSFQLSPNSATDLVVTHAGNDGEQFKVVSVISC